MVRDPEAYEYAAAAERRRNMLRGLCGYITLVLKGQDRRRAFAVVNRFIEVVDDKDAWKALSRAGYTYGRVEDAHYARNVEIRSRNKGSSDQTIDCSTVDEFVRLTI